jgi:hypothetical protein
MSLRISHRGFAGVPEQLKNIYDDQRDVVLLAGRHGLPLAEFEKQLLQQLRSRLGAVVADHLFKLLISE